MTRAALRRWFWVHKWSSLVCTLFLLVICVTGLPLVLRDELSDLLDNAERQPRQARLHQPADVSRRDHHLDVLR